MRKVTSFLEWLFCVRKRCELYCPIKLLNGDCLELMQDIPNGSIDMILCDLPYQMTSCEWDKLIPFDKLWEQYNRITKDNGAIVLFSAQPFTTKLIYSNLKRFKYCWYWVKPQVTGFALAKKQPLRVVEDICVFYNKQPNYKPQGLIEVKHPKPKTRNTKQTDKIYSSTLERQYISKYTNYPKQTLFYSRECKGRKHPTQKPIALLEYLIKTYTDEGETILDNCMGSGSTGVACVNTNRRFIGMEITDHYYSIAKNRIHGAMQ